MLLISDELQKTLFPIVFAVYLLLHMVKFISDLAELCVTISFAVRYKRILPLFLLFCGFMLLLKPLTCLKFTIMLV